MSCITIEQLTTEWWAASLLNTRPPQNDELHHYRTVDHRMMSCITIEQSTTTEWWAASLSNSRPQNDELHHYWTLDHRRMSCITIEQSTIELVHLSRPRSRTFAVIGLRLGCLLMSLWRICRDSCLTRYQGHVCKAASERVPTLACEICWTQTARRSFPL